MIRGAGRLQPPIGLVHRGGVTARCGCSVDDTAAERWRPAAGEARARQCSHPVSIRSAPTVATAGSRFQTRCVLWRTLRILSDTLNCLTAYRQADT